MHMQTNVRVLNGIEQPEEYDGQQRQRNSLDNPEGKMVRVDRRKRTSPDSDAPILYSCRIFLIKRNARICLRQLLFGIVFV